MMYNKLNDFEVKPATRLCEAEERCLQIAYEIELMHGAGVIDLGRLKRLATGEKCTGHDTPNNGELLGTSRMIVA